MNIFGLIGKNIAYSFSEQYFTKKFSDENIKNTTYKVFDLSKIELIKDVFTIPNLKGLNVTIPYKEKIIPYLDELSPEAKKIGAVNTVHIYKGKKIGYNTDVLGFANSLQKTASNHQYQSALILGNGGASKAVQYVLNQQKKTYTIVTRTQQKGCFLYDNLTQKNIQNHLLIVNCTPVGTLPNVEEFPNIPYQFLTNQHICFDLVYNPAQTKFLEKAKKNGAITQNGLEMLFGQAEASWKIWTQ